MAQEQEHPPRELAQLAAQCVDDVKAALGFELDYTIETLPVLDQFCRDAKRTSIWPDGAEQLAQTVGVYFGEVVRRRFNGACRWHISEGGLHEWRLEFEPCFLCFNPLGAALELLLEGEAQGWNAEFTTLPEIEEDLAVYLDRLGGVSEEDFFCLSVRYEVLETVYDFIRAWQSGGHDDLRPQKTYDRHDYDEFLAALAPDLLVRFE